MSLLLLFGGGGGSGSTVTANFVTAVEALAGISASIQTLVESTANIELTITRQIPVEANIGIAATSQIKNEALSRVKESTYPYLIDITTWENLIGSNAYTLTLPQPIGSGELLILVFQQFASFGDGIQSSSNPSGWTELGFKEESNLIGEGSQRAVYKVASGSETIVDINLDRQSTVVAHLYRFKNYVGVPLISNFAGSTSSAFGTTASNTVSLTNNMNFGTHISFLGYVSSATVDSFPTSTNVVQTIEAWTLTTKMHSIITNVPVDQKMAGVTGLWDISASVVYTKAWGIFVQAPQSPTTVRLQSLQGILKDAEVRLESTSNLSVNSTINLENADTVSTFLDLTFVLYTEALLGLALTKQLPIDSLLLLVAAATPNLEAREGLSITRQISVEALQSLAATQQIKNEALQGIANTNQLSLEALIGVLSTHTPTGEGQQGILAPSPVLLEASADLNIVNPIPVESTANLSLQLQLNLEAIAGLLASFTVNLESVLGLAQSIGIDLEGLLGVLSTHGVPTEQTANVLASTLVQMEAVRSIAATAIPSVEALRYVSSISPISSEASADLVFSQQMILEALLGIVAPTPVLQESTADLLLQYSVPLSALQGIEADSVLSAEAIKYLVTSLTINKETLETIQATQAVIQEAIAYIQSTQILPVDSTVGTEAEFVKQIEALQGLNITKSVVTEQLGLVDAILALNEIPVESTVVLSLTNDILLETLESVSKEHTILDEANIGVSSPTSIDVEAIAKVDASKNIVLGALSGVAELVSIRLEALQNQQYLHVVPIEQTVNIAASKTILHEAGVILNIIKEIPLASAVGLNVTNPVLLEAASNLQTAVNIAMEASADLEISNTINIEVAGSVFYQAFDLVLESLHGIEALFPIPNSLAGFVRSIISLIGYIDDSEFEGYIDYTEEVGLDTETVADGNWYDVAEDGEDGPMNGPAHIRMSIVQGTTHPFKFTIKKNGKVRDLTGATAYLIVKNARGDSDADALLNINSVDNVSNFTSALNSLGLVAGQLNPEDSENLPTDTPLFIKLVLVFDDDTVKVPLRGELFVEEV